MKRLACFIKDDTGATAIEYAMIAVTTSLVLVAVLPAIESALDGQYSSVAAAM